MVLDFKRKPTLIQFGFRLLLVKCFQDQAFTSQQSWPDSAFYEYLQKQICLSTAIKKELASSTLHSEQQSRLLWRTDTPKYFHAEANCT